MCDMCIFSDHASLEVDLSKALDRMGDTAMLRDDEEDHIGLAFQKFAVVTKELGALMKNMVRIIYISLPQVQHEIWKYSGLMPDHFQRNTVDFKW